MTQIKYFWFGDSWVVGDELTDGDAFPKIVSERRGAECVNLGQCGSSIDDIPHEFFRIVNKISKEDVVFFCLTASHRVSLFETDMLRRITPNEMYSKHRPHPHADKWYRYFDDPKQRMYNRDRTINLLYYWTLALGIKCWFCNIFTIEKEYLIDATPDSCWLIDKKDCLASCILPVLDKNNLYLDDHPDLSNDQWQKQKHAIEQFIKPNWAHPNSAGHLKIADKILHGLSTHGSISV